MEQQITFERWRQVKEIFQAAVEFPNAEREAYLTGVCAGDPSLLAEVESLLDAHEEPGSFLDTPAFDLTERSAVNALLGKSLGRYRILSLLGRGGMGEVYKAKDTTDRRDQTALAPRRDCAGRADCGHRRRRILQQERQGDRVNRRPAVHQ